MVYVCLKTHYSFSINVVSFLQHLGCTPKKFIMNDSCVNCTLPSSLYPCGIPPFVHGVPRDIDYVQGVLFILVILPSLSLNMFTIFLIAKYKCLQYRELVLALQILVINMVYSIVELTAIVSSFAGDWILGHELCQLVAFIRESTIMIRYLFSLLYAVDRIMTVFAPFWYLQYGKTTTVMLSIGIWVVGLSRGAVPLGLDCIAFVPTAKICLPVSSCSEDCKISSILYIAVTYTLGSIVPFILYVVLLCKAKRIISKRNKHTDKSNKMQLSKRASTTFFILFLTVMICRLPAFIIFITIQIQLAIDRRIPPVLAGLHMVVTRMLFTSLPIFDAIVILRNRDVQLTLQRLFSFRTQKEERFKQSHMHTVSTSQL